MAKTTNTLKFKNLKIGNKFIGTLVGLGASGNPEIFIKIINVESVSARRIRMRGSWNCVRLTDGDICGFSPIQEVIKIL